MRGSVLRLTPAIGMCALWAGAACAEDAGTVKVFVLAGQSNMEGKAPNELFEHQAADPKTSKLFAHLRQDNQWIVRDDVFIKFLDRHGGLTIGYGSPDRTGVELEFGTVLGNHFDEPVLLIKAAWGGHAYHYLGSAIWFNRIGRAMGDAMVELIDGRLPARER